MINSISKSKIFGVVLYVLQNTPNLVISCCCLAEDGNEMYKIKIYIARALLLFCSLNLLFSNAPVAVAVVVCLSSLIKFAGTHLYSEEKHYESKVSCPRTRLKAPRQSSNQDRSLRSWIFDLFIASRNLVPNVAMEVS